MTCNGLPNDKDSGGSSETTKLSGNS